MSAGTPLADALRHRVSTAKLAELPELLGLLEAERVRGLVRISQEAGQPVSGSASDTDALLTMPEVAARLGVSLEHARELGRRRQLPIVRVGQRYVRVRRAALEAFIEERERDARAVDVPTMPGMRSMRRSSPTEERPRSPGVPKQGKLIDLPPRQSLRTTAWPDPSGHDPRRLPSRSSTDNHGDE